MTSTAWSGNQIAISNFDSSGTLQVASIFFDCVTDSGNLLWQRTTVFGGEFGREVVEDGDLKIEL
jgi:hypothetical protein